MCGFAGVISLNNSLDNSVGETLNAMNSVLRHRGPDDGDTKLVGPCGLTHTRLNVIDLTEAGKQPMSNEDGSIWITYNGEVYNFQELRRDYALDLKGHSFRSRTDTEVIIHLYEEKGIDCFPLLNGMYAFALWDTNSNTLHLVRDPYGIKPLFYMQDKDEFWFASEIKALLCIPGFNREPNTEALYHYLSLGYIPGELTAFKGIHELRPGCRLTLRVGDNNQQINRFFNPSYNIDKTITEKDAIETAGKILHDAVARQLIADVPIGVMLSGGLDSSALTALMADIRGDSDFHTFSIAFEDKSFDESSYAALVADHIGTNHHEIRVTPDCVKDLLFTYMSYIDEPYADGSAIPTFLLAESAKDFITVLLSGEGGDEVFAGYDTYSAYKARKLFRGIPYFIRKNIIKPAVDFLPVSDNKLSFEFKAKRFVRGSEFNVPRSHYYWRHILSDEIKNELMTNEFHYNNSYHPSYEYFVNKYNECKAEDELNKLLYIDYSYHLPDDLMIKNDRMTMAHSIEARVPFTDNILFEFLTQVPIDYKMKGFKKKYLLRAILKDRLPDSVLKKKKVGLEMPYSKWFRKELRGTVEEIFSENRINESGLFNPRKVREIIDNHMVGKQDNGRIIWTIMNYLIWYNQYIANNNFINNHIPVRKPVASIALQ